MPRLLIIPAAGLGSRLRATVPKVLVPVGGVPMLDRLLALYRDYVDRVVLIVSPSFAGTVQRHVEAIADEGRIVCVEQRQLTGMLDAILLAHPAASRAMPSSIWITWCDQIAVHPKTIERLAARTSFAEADDLVLPTVRKEQPYIHLERDASGRIVGVLHRREGDVMPAVGESDLGLFALSPGAYFESLPAYGREVGIGRGTGERNFLPFIPWLARTDTVTTFPAETAMEAVGINTPEDLARVEAYLRSISTAS